MKKRLLRKFLMCCMALTICFAMCVSASAMQIFVETPADGTVTLEVESGDSIDNVKEKIEGEKEISSNQQFLFFMGKKLENGRTLADNNVQKNNILWLLMNDVTEPTGTALKPQNISEHMILSGGKFYLDGTLSGGGVSQNGIEISSTLTITGDVTLDLNGYVLKMTGPGSVIHVESGGSLTIVDSKPRAVHKFTVKEDGLWELNEGATGTSGVDYRLVHGGVITGGNASQGGGVYVEADSTSVGSFTMQGGNIVGCSAVNGGGVYVGDYNDWDKHLRNFAVFTMTGGAIVGCTATAAELDNAYGGGIDNWGTTELSGEAVIRDCTAVKYGESKNALGGGVYSLGNLTIKDDVRITDCTAAVWDALRASAAYARDTIHINGGTFDGSVYLGRSCVVTDGIFNGDVENERGTISGGTFAKSGSVFNEKNGKISGGTFFGDVTNDKSSLISGGVFYGAVKNEAAPHPVGTISGGDFSNTTSVTGAYRVSFNTDGGSSVPEQIRANAPATRPTDPTKEDCAFAGWYADEDRTTAYDFTANVTGDITLYAKWTINRPVAPSYNDSDPTYAVTVNKAEHGAVTASRRYAERGERVTLTVEPDKGWTLETLTVADRNGKKIDLAIVTVGEKYTFQMPSSQVTVEATFMEDNTMLNYFVDVSAGDYCYDAVLWAAVNGITSGVDALHFAPDAPCTRGQIVTFLWRAAGSPEPQTMSGFADVAADSYCAKAVAWAVERGITSGTGNGRFSPDAACTRAQAVTFLYRAAGSPAVSGYAEFDDVMTDAYYARAVAWATEQGVTEGVGSRRFAPDDTCARGQIVTFLWRSQAD